MAELRNPGEKRIPHIACMFREGYITVLFMLFIYGGTMAQVNVPPGDVEVSFLKEADSITAGKVHFNVIRIKNHLNEKITVSINLSIPQNWRLIIDPAHQVEIEPQGEYLIPLRLSLPVDVVGGISYLISAVVRYKQAFFYADTYIYISSRSQWNFYLDKSSIFLNEFNPQSQFEIRFSNTGNKEELIRLTFDVGKMVRIMELGESDTVRYFSLPAFTDSLLVYKVGSNSSISYAERETSKNSWKEYSIFIKAATPENKISRSINVKQIQSCETSVRNTQASPLNCEWMLYNMMSSQPLRMNNKVFGTILFKKNRGLGYSLNVNNVYFDPEKNREFSHTENVRFLMTYYGQNMTARLGDNIGAGVIHSINGRGIDLNFKLWDENVFTLVAVQNPITSARGINIMGTRSYGPVNSALSLTYDDNPSLKNYAAYSLAHGLGLRVFKHFNLNGQAVVSYVNYTNMAQSDIDTSLFGFGYRLFLKYDNKKLRLQFTNLNTTYNYLRNSGINRFNIDGDYEIKENMLLYAYFERNAYTATKYPYNFFHPANTNRNDHGRMLYSYYRGKTIYQVGPQYTASSRTYNDNYSGFYTEYTDYSPGLYGSLTYRITNLRSITPNMSINNLNFDFTTNDTLFQDYTIRNNWFYSFGLNYYDYTWRFNVFYTSGATSDLYRSVLTENEPSVSQALHVRPSYERFLKNNTIRLSGYLNFSYYMPSGRENLVLNLSSDYYLKSNWQLFFSFNMFNIARIDEELGRISSRNFNTTIGVRKSFRIQQPRLKFYDIKIVCFNDINGNIVRDEEEKPISNILFTITRNSPDSVYSKVSFPQAELLTDANGQICYNNMPEGIYVVELSPLFNLENMFFLNGDKQVIIVDSKKTIYLPLVQSYKVSGQVTLERDPNSTEGKISLEGIKVTASSEDGYAYAALTDRYGHYILNLPHDKTYRVFMSNVFNENFIIEQQEFTVRFGKNRNLRVDFRVHEKKREIKFNQGEYYRFQNE